jgi:hypothetical protein
MLVPALFVPIKLLRAVVAVVRLTGAVVLGAPITLLAVVEESEATVVGEVASTSAVVVVAASGADVDVFFPPPHAPSTNASARNPVYPTSLAFDRAIATPLWCAGSVATSRRSGSDGSSRFPLSCRSGANCPKIPLPYAKGRS